MRFCISTLLCTSIVLAPALVPADAPVSPANAPGRMTVPDGFKVTLFAGEPDISQPIAIAFDDRGRLWVVECYSYPSWLPRDGKGKDRVVILEDADGDGRFDSRKVFLEDGRNLTGIALGFGGVWLCSTPELVFVPDRNADDVPDGPVETVADGWDLQAKHNVFNGLAWGPDGWLYGLNGILSNSKVGRLGAPDGERVSLNCGVWRLHPVRRTFEAVAHGTTNPWGIDFDDLGRMYITNCVIEHIWHVVPGAHFERMFGQDINPASYSLLKSGVDHIHWAGGPWQGSRGGEGAHGAAGGGHAHSGCMVYLGDNWPDTYRDAAFLCNIHGARINEDLIVPNGSTVQFRHAKDVLFANDPWFRGLAVQYGPDGGVYLVDWNDTGECHDYDDVHRESGRIFKVTFGEPHRWSGDLARETDSRLVEFLSHRNAWHARHAARILEERASAGSLGAATRPALLAMLRREGDARLALRALWALHATGGLDAPLRAEVLSRPEEHVRGWAVQLELEDHGAEPAILEKLRAMAKEDPSPVVRLQLASALQRLPLESRWDIAGALAAHATDATDPYLPLMIWYGAEPLAAADPARALDFLAASRIPLVREHMARRIGSPGALSSFLARSEAAKEAAVQLDVLRGLEAALRGRRSAPMPADWPAARARAAGSGPETREKALGLSLLFGDSAALAELRATVADAAAPAPAREEALRALLQRKDPELPEILRRLIETAGPLRAPSLRGLAAYDEPSTPGRVLASYDRLTDAEKQDAIGTLASRPAYAQELLDAVESGKVRRGDVSAFTARQISSLGDKKLASKLSRVWGDVRPATQAKGELLAKYKAMLSPDTSKEASRSRGRLAFEKTCASCHKLFGEGGGIGPELTGSQRTSLDYLLENLLDPSAVMGRDYQVTVLVTKDGRVLTGIVKEESGNAVTIQTSNEAVIVPLDEIAGREKSALSMMPEDLLGKLSEAEIRDLFAYLSGDGQAPRPAEKP